MTRHQACAAMAEVSAAASGAGAKVADGAEVVAEVTVQRTLIPLMSVNVFVSAGSGVGNSGLLCGAHRQGGNKELHQCLE